MPELGEIRGGVQIGFRQHGKFIWQACEDCGKERWVALSKATYMPCCFKCAIRRNTKAGIYKRSAEKGHNWKGGIAWTSRGYLSVCLCQGDEFFRPMATGRGRVLQHRLVMAQFLGRCLQRWEIVHHKGVKYPQGSIENKQDNRIENLQLVTDDRHKQITILEQRIKHLENRVIALEAEIILLKSEPRNADIFNPEEVTK
jgi:hypothetical protein